MPVASPASLGASPAKAGESSLVRRLSLPFTGGSSSSVTEDSSILARLSSSFEAARHDAIDESGIDVGFLLL